MKPRVILVVPNFRWVDNDTNALWHYIPYNLCLLAAMIEDIADVSILDAYKQDMDQATFAREVGLLSPDVVGITVMMDQYGQAGHIAAGTVKFACPDAKVVMGGVYATMNPEEVIKDKNIDCVVVGEGEDVIRDIVLKGVNTGTIITASRIYGLDTLPLPAYHLIDYPSYINSAERKSVDSPVLYPYARILTSRGCPHGCCFCQVEHISGREFRPRSAASVLAEMKWLKDTYHIKSWIFDDDNLLYDRQRAMDIFNGMIEQDLALPWKMIATAAFKLDKELITAMHASGCTYVNIAVESGTDRVLHKVIGKPIQLDKVKDVVRMLQEYNIYVAANFIIGFPTETWDEIRATLKFADDLNADYTKVFAAMPLRNTKLWRMCEEQKAFKKDFTGVCKWSDGQIETKEFTAKSLGILRAYEWDRINFSTAGKRKKTATIMGITEEELLKIRKDTINPHKQGE